MTEILPDIYTRINGFWQNKKIPYHAYFIKYRLLSIWLHLLKFMSHRESKRFMQGFNEILIEMVLLIYKTILFMVDLHYVQWDVFSCSVEKFTILLHLRILLTDYLGYSLQKEVCMEKISRKSAIITFSHFS